jgi:hypothetical protein
VDKSVYPLRLGPEERRLLAETSAREGVPMSQLLREGLAMRCKEGSPASSAGLSAALRQLAELASRLDSGWILVPPGEAGPSSWGEILGEESSRDS